MKSKDNTVYQIGVYVKDTNQENGPGHVSSFVRKIKDGKSYIKSPTSFFPGPLGSIVNAMSFGSIPVPGMLATDQAEDMYEAEHVMVKNVSKEQYGKAKLAQKEFSDDVQSGRRYYSVFGSLNPIASGVANLFANGKAAYLTDKNYKEKNGFHPPEDLNDIPVYENEVHAALPETKVDNCTTSVAHVLNKVGFNFSNPKVPTFFPSELEKHGFSEIKKEDFISSQTMSSVKK